MQLELRQCFEELNVDRTIGAAVLSATGDPAFCAGIDLKETAARTLDELVPIRATRDSGWEWRERRSTRSGMCGAGGRTVDGAAIGAVFGLVGVCDLIIASERASFGLTEINVELLGDASKALRMVGPFKARMMRYSGRVKLAAEFYRLGAIEEVVRAEQEYKNRLRGFNHSAEAMKVFLEKREPNWTWS